MHVIKNYNNYEDYINHQKEKTLDPVRRKKWLTDEWDEKLQIFYRIFKFLLIDSWVVEKHWLCVGARTGQEVAALEKLGANAVGVDLVACPPYVREGDMHNLPFKDNTFDGIFSNVLDHSLYPDKAVLEMIRVIKPGGLIFLHLQVGVDLAGISLRSQGTYDVLELRNTSDILDLFKNESIIEILRNQKCSFFSSNWELLLKIKK